jgi:hypothetical protein
MTIEIALPTMPLIKVTREEVIQKNDEIRTREGVLASLTMYQLNPDKIQEYIDNTEDKDTLGRNPHEHVIGACERHLDECEQSDELTHLWFKFDCEKTGVTKELYDFAKEGGLRDYMGDEHGILYLFIPSLGELLILIATAVNFNEEGQEEGEVVITQGHNLHLSGQQLILTNDHDVELYRDDIFKLSPEVIEVEKQRLIEKEVSQEHIESFEKLYSETPAAFYVVSPRSGLITWNIQTQIKAPVISESIGVGQGSDDTIFINPERIPPVRYLGKGDAKDNNLAGHRVVFNAGHTEEGLINFSSFTMYFVLSQDKETDCYTLIRLVDGKPFVATIDELEAGNFFLVDVVKDEE